MKQLIIAAVLVSGVVLAGPKTQAVKKALALADAPTEADCDQFAAKMFALTLEEVKLDPRVKAIKSKAERQATIIEAQAELKREQKQFTAEMKKGCVTGGRDGAFTRTSIACMLKCDSLDAMEKCD